MNKVEHNEKNIARLADEVTDSADMGAIVQHFYEDQYDYYTSDKEAFEKDWVDMHMEETENVN